MVTPKGKRRNEWSMDRLNNCLKMTIPINSPQAFASVSADYDKIMGFFDFTHRFFDRLSMIEEKTPQQKPFQRCVARVFSGMLTICSVAQEYAEKKRFSEQLSFNHALFVWGEARC